MIIYALIIMTLEKPANKWLICLTGAIWRTFEVLPEGCLMGGMNKFTLLRAFTMGIVGKDYDTEGQD